MPTVMVKSSTKQRLLLELGRSFIAIPNRKHQDAFCSLVRALSEPDAGRGATPARRTFLASC
jgi:hypothetical protein